MPFETESEPVAESPDYCLVCGNLDFYAARGGWWCHYCAPLPQREVDYGRVKKDRAVPTFLGEPTPEPPIAPFWSPREVLERWEPGFTPEEPVGAALGALALRRAREKKLKGVG